MTDEDRISDLELEVGQLAAEVEELKATVKRLLFGNFLSTPRTVFDEQGRLQV